MKTSELIERLQASLAKHGDRDVLLKYSPYSKQHWSPDLLLVNKSEKQEIVLTTRPRSRQKKVQKSNDRGKLIK